jgi:uncharacterized protein involved in type VI secretion and phage assembly
MSYDPFDLDRPDPGIYGLKTGVVIDTSDPLGLGRVRVRIAGLIDEGSGWALPLGTVGGGEQKRGFFSVPKLNSEVGVLFESGNPDMPFYLSGHWGRPNDSRDVPTSVDSEDPSDAPEIHAFETEEYELVFDDRATSKAFKIKHKSSETEITINGMTGSMELKAQANLKIEATGTIEIEGLIVTINGVVAGSGQL